MPWDGGLRVEWLGEGKWRTTAPLSYRSRHGDVAIPKGFVTDLDSVPRLPLLYWAVKHRTVLGATVHDWLYYEPLVEGRDLTRGEADRVFLDAMRDEGVPRRWRWPIWLGVRVGGWLPWRRHRRRDATVSSASHTRRGTGSSPRQ